MGTFVLNPESGTSDHQKLYYYLGAFIAYSFMSCYPLALNLTEQTWRLIMAESFNDIQEGEGDDDIDQY